MKAITRSYLGEIIYRVIQKNIFKHRQSKKDEVSKMFITDVTDEEMIDFIHSIPYLDDRLKDFIMGNLVERTIIISQSWEIEFLKKIIAWAESFEWLHGDNYFLSEAHINSIRKKVERLKLPY